MDIQSQAIIDFVVKDDDLGHWRMVLVETGPWPEPYSDNLMRVQERLYACIEAAIDGQFATSFPESKGARITIQIDGYDLPEGPVRDFFERFADSVFSVGDYREALHCSVFVGSITFAIDLTNSL